MLKFTFCVFVMLRDNSDLVGAMRYALDLIPETILGSSTCCLVRYDNEKHQFQTANVTRFSNFGVNLVRISIS